MFYSKFITTTACIGLTTILSGCLGSGSGGGDDAGNGTGGPVMFEDNYDAANALVPTSDMPTRIEADYVGQFKAGVNGGSAGQIGQNSEIFGDLDVAVDWTDGQTDNPFSGTASNIYVRDAASGEGETLTGSLNVSSDIPGTIARQSIPASNIAGVAVPAVQTGAFEFGMDGTLSGSEGDLEATVLVGGNFRGEGGEAMVGAVSGGIREVGSTNPAIFDAGIGGVAYMNRQ